jgi:hypothetical protein
VTDRASTGGPDPLIPKARGTPLAAGLRRSRAATVDLVDQRPRRDPGLPDGPPEAIEAARRARWIAQGAPTDGPVVVEVGLLAIEADGTYFVGGWHWDFYGCECLPMTPQALWDFLAARYPVLDMRLDASPPPT